MHSRLLKRAQTLSMGEMALADDVVVADTVSVRETSFNQAFHFESRTLISNNKHYSPSQASICLAFVNQSALICLATVVLMEDEDKEDVEDEDDGEGVGEDEEDISEDEDEAVVFTPSREATAESTFSPRSTRGDESLVTTNLAHSVCCRLFS